MKTWGSSSTILLELVQLAQSGNHRVAGRHAAADDTHGPSGRARRRPLRGGGGDSAAPVRGCGHPDGRDRRCRIADSRLVGIGGGDQRHHQSLSDMVQQSQFFPQFPLSQPDYTNLAVGPDKQRQAVALGLWLFSHGGTAGGRAAARRQPAVRAAVRLPRSPGRRDRDASGLPGRVPPADATPQRPERPGHLPGHGRVRSQRRRGDIPRTGQPLGVRRHPARRPAAEGRGPHRGHRHAPGVAQANTASISSGASCCTAARAPARRTPCGTC